MLKKIRTVFTAGILAAVLAVSASALDSIKAGVVDASALNLRQQATTESASLKMLSNGTDLSVIGEEGEFYKVSAAGTVGYAHKDYVIIKDIMNISNGGGVKVTASALNLRAEPSLSAAVIGKLYEGTTAEIIGINSGWFKVNSSAGTGYISPDYVEYIELSSASAGQASSNSSLGQQVVDKALSYLGVKYVYGGASPSGFDCSGLSYYVYKQFGATLNRSSSAQTSNGYKVSKSELMPGDLVFFSSPGSSSVGHVGIYIGNGQMVHSVKPGRSVEIDTINSGYYSTYYWGARRIF